MEAIDLGYKRFLPHFQNRGKTYFITFCTRDRRILIPEARTIALKEILEHHRKLYYLETAIVMPDHIHVLLIPYDVTLAEIMKQIKGASARDINALLNRSGPLWQREYFDTELRRDESVRQKGEYIAQNPVRAGLVVKADDYPWLWRSWVEGGDDWR